MTPHEYATEVMRVISDGTVRIGVWSEYERDFILNALIAHVTISSTHLELIVDDPEVADFRLVAASPGRVRLAVYRLSTMDRCGADVAAVNEKLAAIGGGS